MLLALRYASIVLPAVLLIRLVQQRLWRLAPFSGLALFLAIGLTRDLVLLKPNYTTHAFTLLWEATLPLLFIGQAWAGISTYQAIAALYPNIGRFAVRLFAACLILAGVGGLALLPFEIHRIGAPEANLRVLFLVQRWVATLLAGGLGLSLWFLSRYPSPLKKVPRNLRIHNACIALYFASYAILYALENMKQLGGAAQAELAQLGIVCIIYATWIVGITRAGQFVEPWPELDPAVGQMIDARYNAAVKLLRQAAGEGGRK